jgi:tetratricopeptide (TPR) repeat protein
LAQRQGSLAILADEWTALAGDKELVASVVEVARRRLKSDMPPLPFGQRLSVGLLAAEADEPALAAEFFELAVKADPNERPLVYELWGMDRLQAEDYAEAAKIYQRAIDEKVVDADNPIFHYYLAGALAVSDRFDEALEQARYAAETVDDSAEFANRVAWVLYLADRREQAIEAYAKMIEQFASVRDSLQVRDIVREARSTLSHLRVKNGQFTEGEELLEQVLDEFPDDIGAANDLGYLWADRGVHLNRALAMIQRAVDAEPENAAYRDSLGWVLHRLGKNQQALEQLKLAVASEEPDGVILDHLGDVHRALGQDDRARKLWQQAIKELKKKKDVDQIKLIRAKLREHKP